MNNASITKIIELLKKIPGISNKQANKIINFFLENNQDFTNDLFSKIIEIQQKTKKCKHCQAYSDNEICDICLDKKRASKLFIVSDNQDIEKIESLDIEKGKYFIFNEIINLKKITELITKKIDLLLENIKKFDEIILCLNTDLNGQITMQYLKKEINTIYPNKNVYQLSIGIPFGMSIESIDPISLKQSILNKKRI
ncbi:toprim domain-containing protein [Metamycoplasma auris]|uniref:DNA replication and repair protein RecR n=1 Tax=Metamycoplasma auris TaxID=51363 RepID=A0A2W7FZZ2_9BACT|nr:toprim domain-containing protein [Metamycoplasma auris]PZV99881.1 DNA replication and repair protein RecR [Metamycoplasma auris]